MRQAPAMLVLAFAALMLSSSILRGEVRSETAAISTYEARGVLRSFDPQTRQAAIAHEAIPGYMPAMTMNFEVRDAGAFAGMHPGDLLSFHLCVTADRAWIEQVRKTGSGAAPPLEPAARDSGRELSEGDLLPDAELVNEKGQNFRLSDFRGEPVAITFIYTRCPLPTYCPLMERNFQAAQSLLARLETGKRWHLLSISMDPGHDVPDVLAAMAESYQADAACWTFATASQEAVRRLGGAVGLEFKNSGGQISHNLRTVVVDGAGRIRRIYRGNSWTPQELAAEMRSAMGAAR